MPSKTKLTIAGFNNIHKGVYDASIKNGVVELVFSRNGEIITKASLGADRVSFYQTLIATEKKITMLCNRHDIDEQNLEYDKNGLGKSQVIFYKLMMLRKIMFQAFIPIQWVLTYKYHDEQKWHRIIPDSKVFQADTFVVYKNEKYYIFYEELEFKDYHGYLMVGELDIENNCLINEKIILKLDYHLSFPNVFEENGTYYMIPETGESDSVDLYECTSFPYSWQKKKTLIENISAVDTTPLKTNDAWYLFTTEIVEGACSYDELSIYKSDDLLSSPFKKLYDKPVVTDVTNARMAGHFIHRDGELFRVSQDCGKRYGHRANINKVIQIEGGYKEKLVETLSPEFGALGFHTYNQDHDLIVGDMEIARFDTYSLKRFVWGNIKKLLTGKR